MIDGWDVYFWVKEQDEAAQPRARSLALICLERERQIRQEGWSPQHDRRHSLHEWRMLIGDYLGRATLAAESEDVAVFRRCMEQIGALALAALEAVDAPPATPAARAEEG